MIHGSTTALTALQAIEASPFVFYLTGSRYFGNSDEESDWDFFTTNCEEVKKWLLSNGWWLDSTSYAKDPVCIEVYKRDNVHVQLVLNVTIKDRVQWQLKKIVNGLADTPTKKDMQLLWKMGMSLYADGQNAKHYLQTHE